MNLEITSITILFYTILILILSVRIVLFRRHNKISLGNGDNTELERRIRAHANATEYGPLVLILLLTNELTLRNNSLLITVLASIFIIGRYVHAYAISKNPTSILRVFGMACTYTSIGLLALILIFSLF